MPLPANGLPSTALWTAAAAPQWVSERGRGHSPAALLTPDQVSFPLLGASPAPEQTCACWAVVAGGMEMGTDRSILWWLSSGQGTRLLIARCGARP